MDSNSQQNISLPFPSTPVTEDSQFSRKVNKIIEEYEKQKTLYERAIQARKCIADLRKLYYSELTKIEDKILKKGFEKFSSLMRQFKEDVERYYFLKKLKRQKRTRKRSKIHLQNEVIFAKNSSEQKEYF
jgi:predicted ATP-grasp superfamily ATP-dependent carboligase